MTKTTHSLQPPRGMHDLFDANADRFEFVIEQAKGLAHDFKYRTLHTPLVEQASLYKRNLGESSDVVSKEIYKVSNCSGNDSEELVLRPEFTAGVARFFVEQGRHTLPLPQGYFSYGAVFRHNRPQKGRYRQFNQLNFELFGKDCPIQDRRLLFTAIALLRLVGLALDTLVVKVNFLADVATREEYVKRLKAQLIERRDKLSALSQQRIETNPLRVLDSNDQRDKEALKDIVQITDCYTKEYKDHVDSSVSVIKTVLASSCEVIVDTTLVRGLDYYDGFVFEIEPKDNTSQQGALIGGGRYSRLISELSNGKVNTSVVGFACGVERLINQLI